MLRITELRLPLEHAESALRAAVLAGDDKAEVTVRRAAGVLYERRENAGREKSAAEAGGLARTLGQQGDNRSGLFGQRQAGLAQRCFHVCRVCMQSLPGFAIGS